MDYYINDGLGNSYLSLENPLIHVCDSIDTINKIIENGFRFSYCKERICDANRYVELSYPLIAFSDLNWDIAIHILRTYGHSSIAMKKSWAEENKLTPVLYFERNADLTKTLIEGFDVIKNVSIQNLKSSISGDLIGERHKYYKQIIDIASYSKNYYGQLIRHGELKKQNYCFGCEREWRAVLRNVDIQPFILSADKIDEANKIANNHFLTFEFDDIEYFVIEVVEEEKAIKEKLKKKFGKNDDEVNKIIFKYDTTRHSPDE